jgi:hypothetical protein
MGLGFGAALLVSMYISFTSTFPTFFFRADNDFLFTSWKQGVGSILRFLRGQLLKDETDDCSRQARASGRKKGIVPETSPLYNECSSFLENDSIMMLRHG